MTAALGSQQGAGAWVVLEGRDVPEEWRERAMQVTLVPLLPPEAAALLVGGRTAPVVGPFEEQLLRLLGAGLGTGEMARQAHVPQRTIQRHLARLRSRLGAESNDELAALAARLPLPRVMATQAGDAPVPGNDAGNATRVKNPMTSGQASTRRKS